VQQCRSDAEGTALLAGPLVPEMMNGLGLGVMLLQRRRLTVTLTAGLTEGLAVGRVGGSVAGAAACQQVGVRRCTIIMLLLRRAAAGQLAVMRRIGRRLRRRIEAGTAGGMLQVLQEQGSPVGAAAGRLRQVMVVSA
jgi:hypothetical protein